MSIRLQYRHFFSSDNIPYEYQNFGFLENEERKITITVTRMPLDSEKVEETNALDYWNNKSDCGPSQQVAIQIALLKPSSANIERVFSTLKYIQSSWLYNLSNESLTMLARVKIELLQREKMLSLQTSKKVI